MDLKYKKKSILYFYFTNYGKSYNLKSSSEEIRVEEAAAYVDAKMHELAQARKKTPYMDLSVLAALNIAMELLELQKETGINDQIRDEKKTLKFQLHRTGPIPKPSMLANKQERCVFLRERQKRANRGMMCSGTSIPKERN